ncbi:ABC transporter permease [Reticulibacter mediterranei]|uniref:ABC transporter permease n=1 Tax=Reticulibacter mediterranei TaxID=2778369 RepID=A0A8J3N3T8_9CHLR|nr:carbohydrate ABC transporter permease [Reticulibacter mediterranei]GHO94525.1 ABC transporter permease [Reticulibacter mediterranei]
MIHQVGRTKQRIWTRTLTHAVIIIGAVLMLYPVLWLIGASFKPLNETFTNVSLIPRTWTLSNYTDGWTALDYSFDVFFGNSLIVCLGAVVGNVVSCSLAAYAFARVNFKFKAFWFMLMLGTIMLPYNVVIVPQYVLFKDFGWVNTFLPLIVPKFLATDAFFIFLLVQFIRAIPRDLDDAAKIDGCNHFQMYLRIILPLAMPALATTAIFTFIWTWSDFFTQLIFLNDQSVYTVPVALRTFLDGTGVSAYGQLFAVSVISLIPIFGFFIAFQRLLIEGAASSGIKG